MPRDRLHDSPSITLNMMLTDINSVRWQERVKTGQAVINGVSIANLSQSLKWARELSDARTERTVVAIKEVIRNKGH